MAPLSKHWRASVLLYFALLLTAGATEGPSAGGDAVGKDTLPVDPAKQIGNLVAAVVHEAAKEIGRELDKTLTAVRQNHVRMCIGSYPNPVPAQHDHMRMYAHASMQEFGSDDAKASAEGDELFKAASDAAASAAAAAAQAAAMEHLARGSKTSEPSTATTAAAAGLETVVRISGTGGSGTSSGALSAVKFVSENDSANDSMVRVPEGAQLHAASGAQAQLDRIIDAHDNIFILSKSGDVTVLMLDPQVIYRTCVPNTRVRIIAGSCSPCRQHT